MSDKPNENQHPTKPPSKVARLKAELAKVDRQLKPLTEKIVANNSSQPKAHFIS